MIILILIMIVIAILMSTFTYAIDKYVKDSLEPKMQLYPHKVIYRKLWNVLSIVYWGICAGGLALLVVSTLALLYSFAKFVFAFA